MNVFKSTECIKCQYKYSVYKLVIEESINNK